MKDAGIKADSSRISRWESGLEPLSPRLVRAYECATDATPLSLLAARQMLVRGSHLHDRDTDRRLEALGSDQRKAGGAPIKRSVANLLSALWHRVTRGETDEQTIHDIAAILDEAAQKIERLKRPDPETE